jgi:hypothetical protein
VAYVIPDQAAEDVLLLVHVTGLDGSAWESDVDAARARLEAWIKTVRRVCDASAPWDDTRRCMMPPGHAADGDAHDSGGVAWDDEETTAGLLAREAAAEPT